LILYLDTSALVKLYAEEPGSDEVRNAVQEASAVAVSEVGYVEARSALARKEREGFFSTEEHNVAAGSLSSDFRKVYLTRRVTGGVIALAGELVREHALRAYDAVHLATALILRDQARERAPELTQETRSEDSGGKDEARSVNLLSYDGNLVEAALKEGLAYTLG
jgi:predicted nucleic acid-binding protein